MSRTIAETSESENQICSSTPSRPAFACAIISTEFGELFGVLIAPPPIKAQKAHSAAIGLGFFAIRQGRDCPLP